MDNGWAAGDGTMRRALATATRREAESHTWDAVFDRRMGWDAGLAERRSASPLR